jgi:hypothetical protein
MYIHSLLLEQFSGLESAFGTTFRVTGGYLEAGTSFLRRFTGTIFKISVKFHRAIKNFLYKMEKIVKTISAQTKN